MNAAAAFRYARTVRDGWWRWDDDGGSIVWNDGTTITFRSELKAVLELLAPSGLPPFPAVVLILAALRGKIPNSAALRTDRGPAGERGQLLLALDQRRQEQTAAGLKLLGELAPRLGARVSDRALLIETILEKAPRLEELESAAIAENLLSAFGANMLNGARDEESAAHERALQLVLDGLRPYTVEMLLARVRTGLDVAPTAGPELELPKEERARRLFASLEADDELAGVAQVARDLMAALRVPQLLVEPDELALGGASDLTNRGSLDRLLISELAYDDLTLATRVALNEALYLRREPPVHRPERSLAVLLDSGLRTWGVPRVLGAAATLALLARRDGHGRAQVWRADGRKLAPVDLLARAGLDAHLAALATDLSPAAAVPDWRAALEAAGDADAVIVTHRDALRDAGFQARLAEAKLERGFLVLVERDGTVELHPLPWGSPRPLASAKIDVEKLLPRPKATTKEQRPPPPPLIDPTLDDLPAFFRQRPCPLLLPVNAKVSRAESVEGGGGLCVTEDGRLFHWEKPGRGARQLATDLPGGRVSWLGLDRAKEHAIVVKGRSGDGRSTVTIVALDGRAQPRIARFTGPPHILGVVVEKDVILLILNTRVVAVDVEAAEVLTETNFPAGTKWINGRYFSDDIALLFAAWDGGGIVWESTLTAKGVAARQIATAFDHQGIGVWVLLLDGRLLGPTGAEVLKLGVSVYRAQVRFVDGGFTVFTFPGKEFLRVWIQPARVEKISSGQLRTLDVSPAPPGRAMRTKFIGAALSKTAGLRLLHRDRTCFELGYTPQRGLHLVSAGPAVQVLEIVPAAGSMASHRRRLGCNLLINEQPSGVRAWLDDRGLLHLRGRDSTTQEITLALTNEGSLAGWCSDGTMCGPEFFRPEGVPDEPRKVRDALKALWSNA